MFIQFKIYWTFFAVRNSLVLFISNAQFYVYVNFYLTSAKIFVLYNFESLYIEMGYTCKSLCLLSSSPYPLVSEKKLKTAAKNEYIVKIWLFRPLYHFTPGLEALSDFQNTEDARTSNTIFYIQPEFKLGSVVCNIKFLINRFVKKRWLRNKCYFW